MLTVRNVTINMNTVQVVIAIIIDDAIGYVNTMFISLFINSPSYLTIHKKRATVRLLFNYLLGRVYITL